MTAAHGSSLTILAISFERYYAICKPLKAGYKCTRMRALIIIKLVWIVAVLVTAPMLVITELSYVEYVDGSIVPVCLNSANNFWHVAYFASLIIIFFCIPFIILVILYGLIVKNLMMDSRVVCSTSEKRHLRQRKQVVFMLATVVVTFFVCLMPFRILVLWIILASQEKVQQLGMETYYNLLYLCRVMLYLNSAINPLLYNAISTKFREGFCRTLGYKNLRRCSSLRPIADLTSTTNGNECLKAKSSVTVAQILMNEI
ncbi:growth hormone secretagogue receptor type 1-like protein [Dinothrombium tinctorium]|nr:growth hormone secretagogue receptor type 1-like protein [Dinothrombium tinctorium]